MVGIKKEVHGRDKTILIVLATVVNDCALLQLVPVHFLINLSSQLFLKIQYCLLNTRIPHQKVCSNGAACSSYINNCLKVKYPLRVFDNPLHSSMN